jgi:hypothetical protein
MVLDGQAILRVQLRIGEGNERKIIKCLEKFGKGLKYSVVSANDTICIEFFAHCVSDRTEIFRRLRHIKNLKIISTETHKVSG